MSVEDYGIFIGRYKHFYVYDVHALSWMVSKLREDRADLREIGREAGATLYEVSIR